MINKKNDSEQVSILLVDDTPENLDVLIEMLERENYVLRPVPNGKLAIQAAQNNIPDLILLDINMSDMDGYEVCSVLKADDKLKDIPVIFISARSDSFDKIKAFTLGAVDYITKPFQLEEVQARVATHLKIHKFQTDMEDLVNEKIKELYESQMATIFALAKISETRDEDTGSHLERVQTYCRLLGYELSNSPKFKSQIDISFIEDIFHSSPLHDIGKVAIPDNILLKPGKLTEEEFDIMKTHSAIGADYLKSVYENYPNNSFIKMGIEIARDHHEKWNGKGYPNGLSGEKIPLSARIMAIADVYDALRTKRPYKKPFNHNDSCEIIINGSGTHFDPAIIEAFKKIESQFETIAQQII